MAIRKVTTAALALGIFAIIGTGMVAATYEGTRAQIAANEQKALENALYTIIPRALMNNRIYQDRVMVKDSGLFATDQAVPVFIARQDDHPVAAVFSPVAPDGYSGQIKLLVGVSTKGRITGVRVVSHKETPGLGDDIEARKSQWVLGFNQKSLNDPGISGWGVKKDGGDFDQFTGATISPRAVVKAVHRTLEYFAANRERLFAKNKKEH